MKANLEKISEIEDEICKDDLVFKYLSSKMQYKYNPKNIKSTNRKILELCETPNLVSIDAIIIYLNEHDEKGVSDYLINTVSMNSNILDKSFFYLNQLTTMLTYKKYKYPIEQYIIDKGIRFLKFSVRISLFLNSFKDKSEEIQKMKFRIEQIMRSSYSDIKDSQLNLKKKLKYDDFIVAGRKNKNDAQVNYYYRCLEFFENLKKLCLLLFNYPTKLEGNNSDKKLTRKTALQEFIKLFNEDLEYMRGEEYDKMKKEERINKKKKTNKTKYKNSKFNKGFILPFNNDISNADEHALIIVNILPEYSSPFSTKERVPVKLTCECIELGEAKNEHFFDKYVNNKFFEKHNENIIVVEDDSISSSLYSSNISEVLEKQLSIFPKEAKIFDKWKNLEKSLPSSKDELNKPSLKEDDVKALKDGIAELAKTATQFAELGKVADKGVKLGEKLAVAEQAAEAYSTKLAAAGVATDSYAAATANLAQSYAQISNDVANVAEQTRAYKENVNEVGQKLASLNSVYELQLQAVNAQVEAQKSVAAATKEAVEAQVAFANGAKQLQKQVADLNGIYGNMLNALA